VSDYLLWSSAFILVYAMFVIAWKNVIRPWIVAKDEEDERQEQLRSIATPRGLNLPDAHSNRPHNGTEA
jgi:hypothetical protein